MAGFLTENSDGKLKKDIVKIDSALDKINKLNGVSYKWKDKEKRDDKKHIGLIAQDVEAVFPEVVLTDANGIKSVGYGSLVAPLVEAVKELKAKDEALQVENDALKEEIKSIKKNFQAENDMMKKELQLLKEQMLAITVANDDKELAQK